MSAACRPVTCKCVRDGGCNIGATVLQDAVLGDQADVARCALDVRVQHDVLTRTTGHQEDVAPFSHDTRAAVRIQSKRDSPAARRAYCFDCAGAAIA